MDKRNRRKMLWPLNVIAFNINRLIPFRDKKLWVFGAWEGWKYDDNSKYLFEFVNQKYGGFIRCVWLANEESTVKSIRSMGYEAYTSDSLIGKKIQRAAGVAIYTNGLIDFGYYPKVAGAFVVSLWHGVGFKKIYNEKYSGAKLFMKKTMDKLFSWTYRNLTVAPSEFVLNQFRRAFSLSPRALLAITGQPRNDIFSRGVNKTEVLKLIGVDSSKKTILYMPTYRGNGLPSDAMEQIIKDLYFSKELQETLKRNNCVFIAKLHPMTPHIDLKNRDDFIILDNGAVSSNQELLAVSDVLVTDYSSCVVDFALLGRPIVFYTPDQKDFLEKSEPLYDEFFDLCNQNNSCSPLELSQKIDNPSMLAVEAINALFEDFSIKGSCYSENVFKTIAGYIGIEYDLKE